MRTVQLSLCIGLLLSAAGCKKQLSCTETSFPPEIAALQLPIPGLEPCLPRVPGVGYEGVIRGKKETEAWIAVVGSMERAGWVRISQTGHGGRFARGRQVVRILLAPLLEYAGPPVSAAIELEPPMPR